MGGHWWWGLLHANTGLHQPVVSGGFPDHKGVSDFMSRRCRRLGRPPQSGEPSARLGPIGPPRGVQARAGGPGWVLVVVLGLVLSWVPVASRGADALPDPRLLFRGVESVRQQIPPSRLVLRAAYRGGIDTSILESSLSSTTISIVFHDPSPVLRSRALFDGKKILHYDGGNSVTIRDLHDTTADYLFDPRLLGITADFVCGQTLDDVLPYRVATSLPTVGRERVGDRPTWHVRLADTNTYNRRIDMWVDEERNFRVYRYEYSLAGGRPSPVLPLMRIKNIRGFPCASRPKRKTQRPNQWTSGS